MTSDVISDVRDCHLHVCRAEPHVQGLWSSLPREAHSQVFPVVTDVGQCHLLPVSLPVRQWTTAVGVGPMGHWH